MLKQRADEGTHSVSRVSKWRKDGPLPELCDVAAWFPNTASNFASNAVPFVAVVGEVAAGIFISRDEEPCGNIGVVDTYFYTF